MTYARTVRYRILERLASRPHATATQIWRSLNEQDETITWKYISNDCCRLKRLGLVETETMILPIEGSRKAYKITERGREILETYKVGE